MCSCCCCCLLAGRRTLSRWQALSCRRLKDQQGVAEGPIRTMLVRDDRAWVGGGRTDPWIGLFDAVLGECWRRVWCLCARLALACALGVAAACLRLPLASSRAAAAGWETNPPPPRLVQPDCVDVLPGVLPTGTQLDMWSCGHFGSCLAMTSLVTSDALTEMAAATTSAAAAAGRPSQRGRPGQGEHVVGPGLDVPPIVPEDNIGEDPRSGWRLVTGHESGQLLLWNAAADRLAPVIKIGDPGLSPVKALCAMEQQGLLAVVHANGDLAMFLRPSRDRDWHMGPTTLQLASAAASDGGGAAAAPGGGSAGPSSSEQLPSVTPPGAQGERGRSGGGGSAAGAALTTIKPRRVVLRSHRSMLVAAAACSNGVVTANAVGTIKLWPADGLGKEAERFGLCATPLHVQATRESRCGLLG